MFQEALRNILIAFIGEEGVERLSERNRMRHAMRYWCIDGGPIMNRPNRKPPFEHN